jgi:Fe-S-cluster containining protein
MDGIDVSDLSRKNLEALKSYHRLWKDYAKEEVLGKINCKSSEKEIFKATKEIYEWAEWCWKSLKKQTKPLPNCDCKSGCSYCCYMLVEISDMEARAIAHYISVRGDRRLIQKIYETASMLQELNGSRMEAKIPCAFLDDKGRCSIYRVRPLACRGFSSSDVQICKAGFGKEDGVTNILADQVLLFEGVMDGIREAMQELGMSSDRVEMNQAIASALKFYQGG